MSKYLRVIFVGKDQETNLKVFLALLETYREPVIQYKNTYVVDLLLPQDPAKWLPVKDALREATGWVIGGPRCPRCSTEDNWHLHLMTYSSFLNSWGCLNRGCGEKLEYKFSSMISFNDFRTEVNRTTLIPKGRAVGKSTDIADKKDWFVLTDGGSIPLAYNFPQQASMADVSKPSKNDIKAVGDKIQKAFEEAFKGLNAKMAIIDGNYDLPPMPVKIHELRDKTSEQLLLAADRAFRFYAGVNFQDHSIAEQREHLEVIRGLQKALEQVKHPRGQPCLTSSSQEPIQTTTAENVKT